MSGAFDIGDRVRDEDYGDGIVKSIVKSIRYQVEFGNVTVLMDAYELTLIPATPRDEIVRAARVTSSMYGPGIVLAPVTYKGSKCTEFRVDFDLGETHIVDTDSLTLIPATPEPRFEVGDRVRGMHGDEGTVGAFDPDGLPIVWQDGVVGGTSVNPENLTLIPATPDPEYIEVTDLSTLSEGDPIRVTSRNGTVAIPAVVRYTGSGYVVAYLDGEEASHRLRPRDWLIEVVKPTRTLPTEPGLYVSSAELRESMTPTLFVTDGDDEGWHWKGADIEDIPEDLVRLPTPREVTDTLATQVIKSKERIDAAVTQRTREIADWVHGSGWHRLAKDIREHFGIDAEDAGDE